MLTVEDVIAALRKPRGLEDALILAHVVAHKLNNRDMESWVDAELTGYGDASPPAYRTVALCVYGDVVDHGQRHPNEQLRLSGLSEETRTAVTTRIATESISVVEDWIVKERNGAGLRTVLRPEHCEEIASSCYRGKCQIERAWGVPVAGAILQVRADIRSKLLRFTISLLDDLDIAQTPNDPARTSNRFINDLCRGIVVGDNNTIVIGDRKTQHSISCSVSCRNFVTLTRALEDCGISGSDVDDLRRAVELDDDRVDRGKKEFGPLVREWIRTMISKAGTEAWRAATTSGLTMLYTALKAYYGR
jgi:AbiTii-like protein